MNKLMILVAAVAASITASATNFKLGRAVDGNVQFAPDGVTEGYYPIEDVRPSPSDGEHNIAVDYWVERDGKCVCVYKEVPIVKPPREFSVYHITRALKTFKFNVGGEEIVAWPLVLSYIKENDLYEEYVSALTFDEDNPLFIAGVAKFKEQFNLTDEQIEQVLSSCVAK